MKVKYCGMEETTKLLKLVLNMIKFDSNYEKREHVKCDKRNICLNVKKPKNNRKHNWK